jgi:hypothetical protein
VETKQLKRQVRRNIDRFPDDFMFELSDEEFQEWRSHFGTSNEGDKNGLAVCSLCVYGALMENKVTGHDENIQLIFTHLKQLLNPPQEPRPRVGFRRKDEQN